jgi:hypothetical protein
MMPEMGAPLAADPAALGGAEVNPVVNRFVVDVPHPDSRHELHRLTDVAGERPDNDDRYCRDTNGIGQPHEEVVPVAGRTMVFVVERPDDAPEAMKHEPVQQVFQQGPKKDAQEKREHVVMLALWI